MALTINNFNIGQDLSVVIQSDSGLVIPACTLGLLMDFDVTADDVMLKIVPICNGGMPIYNTIWQGWSGKLTFTRFNGAITNMIAQLMNDFYNSGAMPHFSISCSVLNRDNSVDQYLFTGVVWTKPTFGNFKADKEVDQTLNFQAQNMIATAGGVGTVGVSSGAAFGAAVGMAIGGAISGGF